LGTLFLSVHNYYYGKRLQKACTYVAQVLDAKSGQCNLASAQPSASSPPPPQKNLHLRGVGKLMKVSIITASFRCAQTIEDCIKSIINQTYPNIEHIIIDGGSKDGTLEVAGKYRDRLARVVSEPDRGNL